jgi:hypothetical protein
MRIVVVNGPAQPGDSQPLWQWLRQAVRSRSPHSAHRGGEQQRQRLRSAQIGAKSPALRSALSAINDNYLNVQQDILETFIDRGQLRKLAEPTITPTGKRIPGLKLDHPRQLALMRALVRFAHIAGGSKRLPSQPGSAMLIIR